MSNEKPEVGSLVTQPHGGALKHGSKPGGPAGPGRPPAYLRGELRGVLEGAIEMLRDVSQAKIRFTLVAKCPECGHEADTQTTKPLVPKSSDVLRAIEIAAKFGLGAPNVGYDEALVDELAAATAAAARDVLEGENVEEFINACMARWVPILARKKREG